ncbi:hypothetical protein L2E82_37208 [Cichorium intybus]|uniref:Uncharacterized protein n=1 Tax=Cichorium intybus TaxID=13427 RepID=A0ACB9AEI4_CICIN|nr:hypothetical protein L2E82_37208 [Cichorium intybus]
MQALRQQASSSSSPVNLLPSLINSFPPVLDHREKIEKFETPESIFTDLIELHGQNNEFQEAIDLFFRLPNFRCTPSVDSLNCLLSVLCKRKDYLILDEVVLVGRSR